MAYIGKSIESGTFSVLDTSGNTYNGSNTAFNLGTQVGSVAQLLVSHDGVIQKPGTDYTLSSGGAAITFTTAPASGASIFIVEISGAVGGPLDSDLNGTELILDADGDTSLHASTDDQIDFKAGGTDVMSMTATGLTINDGTTITTADNTDTLTLTSTDADATSGPNLRLYRNSSSPADSDKFGQIDFEGRNDNSQDFVAAQIVVNSGDVSDGTEDAQIEFDVMTGGTLREYMRFASGSEPTIVFNEDSQDIDFRVETNGQTHALFVNGAADGKVSINEASPDTGDGGLCLNQTSDDNFIFTLKSNDVAHGITAQAETDTYGAFKKTSATNGGLTMQGYAEGSLAMLLAGLANRSGVNDAESNSAFGIIDIRGHQTTSGGNDVEATGADNNVVSISNAGTTAVIFKGDGEIFSNQTATVGVYDTYEDAQLIRAYDLNRGENVKGLIDSKFDKFVKYNQKDLMNAKLIGKDKEGNPTNFVNLTGMSRLHNGAIWQQYEKHNQLLEAVYDLAKEAVGEEKANAILDKHEVKRLN